MKKNNNSIAELVNQYVHSFRETLIGLQASVSKGDTSGIQGVVDQVKKNGFAQHIASLVASSSTRRDELTTIASQHGAAGDVMFGLIVAAAGGALYTGAAGIAVGLGLAAAGAASGLITVVGVILIVIGIFIVGKQLLAQMKQKASGLSDSINSIKVVD